MIRTAVSALVLFATATASEAGQSLIPTPYPSGAPGAAPLNTRTSGGGGGQQIMQDPYPQTTGSASQGNPTTRRRIGGQRLVPSINQRKYDVDRPPR